MAFIIFFSPILCASKQSLSTVFSLDLLNIEKEKNTLFRCYFFAFLCAAGATFKFRLYFKKAGFGRGEGCNGGGGGQSEEEGRDVGKRKISSEG